MTIDYMENGHDNGLKEQWTLQWIQQQCHYLSVPSTINMTKSHKGNEHDSGLHGH